MSEKLEMYYAEMESARNEALDNYFRARPQLQRTFDREALFQAAFSRGYDSAYQKYWQPESTDKGAATP